MKYLQQKSCEKIILVSFLIVFIVMTSGLIFVQKPWEDESMFASASYHLAKDDFMGIPEFEWYDWKNADKVVYFMPPLSMLVSSIWIKISGFDLFRYRSISLLWGLIGIIAFYYFLKFLKIPSKIVLLTIALICIDFIYTRRSACGRNCDIISASLVFLSYAVYVSLREKNFKLSLFLSNTFMMLSGLTHPNALIGFLGLVYLILYLDKKRVTLNNIFVSIIPYLVGGICYGVFILKDFDSFKAQFLGNAKQSMIGLDFIIKEIEHRYLFMYGGIGRNVLIYTRILLLIPVMYLIALVYNGLKIKENDSLRPLFFLTLIYLISSVFYGKKTPGYLVYIIPFYSLNVTNMFFTIKNKNIKILVGGLVSIMIFSSICVNIFRYKRNEYKKYLEDCTKIKKLIPENEIINGRIELGFCFGWNRIIEDRTIGFFSKKEYRYLIGDDAFNENIISQDFSKYEGLQQHILDVLKKYKPIWQGNIYKIYKKENG